MTLPGNTLTRDDTESQVGPNLNLSTVFVVCETQRAPDGVHRIRSMRDYATVCGARTLDTAAGYDWLETHFRNGGAAVLLTPLRGAAAVAASADLVDAVAAVSATITWSVPGADGNRASIDVDAGDAGGFVVNLLVDDEPVHVSPSLADQVALQTWALAEGLVIVTPGAGGDPVPTVSPIALEGGDDDFDGIGVAEVASALTRFTPARGPGSFVLPGRTSPASHAQIADALVASRINRVAHLAMPDVDAETIAAQALDMREHAAADLVDHIAGRMIVPGLTPTTAGRKVTLDALRTGRQGANDAAGVTPNQPAAGTFGQAIWGTSLEQRGSAEPWTDAERELLYDAGVNVAMVVDGAIRLYGSRTAADPEADPAGIRLGSARLRMALLELLRYQIELVQFHELDAAGVRIKELQGQIEGDVNRYPTSIHTFRVVCGVEGGATPGTAVLTAAIEDLQVSHDAEVIRASISRTIKGV